MVTSTEVRLRPAGPADEPGLVAAFVAGRPELALLPAELVRLQLTAQRQQYSAAYPGTTEFVIAQHAEPVGRCLTWLGPDELRLLDISILAEHRGHGIGRSVLAGLASTAEQARVPLRLSVWSANEAAIRWYAASGFEQYDEWNGYRYLQLAEPGRAR